MWDIPVTHFCIFTTKNKEVNLVRYMCMVQYFAQVDCYDWWNLQETTMTGQICRKVVAIGQNYKVGQDSQVLVEFCVNVALTTSWSDWVMVFTNHNPLQPEPATHRLVLNSYTPHSMLNNTICKYTKVLFSFFVVTEKPSCKSVVTLLLLLSL